jgi:hypothetical protein
MFVQAGIVKQPAGLSRVLLLSGDEFVRNMSRYVCASRNCGLSRVLLLSGDEFVQSFVTASTAAARQPKKILWKFGTLVEKLEIIYGELKA